MLTLSRKRDENGLVGVVLTIVIVWALLAVIELTRTTVAAEEINNTVASVIQPAVISANGHLNTGCEAGNCPSNALPVLSTTETLAAKINTAAVPLSAQLAQVKMDTGEINGTAQMILTNATSINTTVQSINSLVLSIGSSVGSIHNSFVGINTNVNNDITPGLVTATNQAAIVVNEVNAIKTDTDTIDFQAKGILVQAEGICSDQPVTLLGIAALGALAGKDICNK
jgi:hypothetical protein